ncbi:MAG TPA: DUF5985 family protein [Thermoanaerobaculia bacterium]|nr:DUF5985 family protein [Thermoanaerobaculia bacterium]
MSMFLSGALTMGYAVAGLFFLRFWRDSHDRLFAFFSAAFWILAVQRTVVTLWHVGEAIYLFRALAFILIIIAIVDKNRR